MWKNIAVVFRAFYMLAVSLMWPACSNWFQILSVVFFFLKKKLNVGENDISMKNENCSRNVVLKQISDLILADNKFVIIAVPFIV